MNAKNSIAESIASMRLTTLSLALASSFLLCSGAEATGLGKLTVLSALGQPLRAEIELTAVSKDDAGSVVPKLASAEAFRQANVAYSSTLSGLSFVLETRGARQFVIVTSAQSVNEPFLEILVELNSSSGKLVREYTMLLDPVEMQANNAPLSSSNGKTISRAINGAVPQAAVSAAATRQPTIPVPVANPGQSATAEPLPKPNPVAIPAPAPSANRTPSYKIKAGDTLTRIADQYKPAGVSMEQMLVALQRENSGAFIDNNMNLLRSGRILTIPDVTQIEQTQPVQAQKIVLAQAADFTAYRNRLATQVQQASADQSSGPKKSDSGKITAKVTETPSAVSESKDKLTLSRAAQVQALADKKVQDEDKIARQKALDEANARVKELEANTARLKNILDLKNEENAKAKARAEAQKIAVGGAASAVAPASASSAAQSETVAVPKQLKPVPKLAITPPLPVPEPGPTMMAQVMQYLPLGAGVLALLGLAGLWSNRRKKKAQPFDDESILTGSSIKTNSLFGSTGGQSVDTNNSVFNSNFAPSASQLDANEVDPVAEADVYIAYGRDEQAEEILKEALRTQPDRQAVRVKLLEIYAHRKDVRTFENVASELYGMTGGEGADWQQAAALGVIIDPQNPLYAGGQGLNHAAALGAATLPVESLDPESLLGNSLSQEMLESISAKKDAAPSTLMGEADDRPFGSDDLAGGLDFDLGLTTAPEPDFTDEGPKAAPGPEIPDHAQSVPGHEPFTGVAPAAGPVDELVSNALPDHDLSMEFDLDNLTTENAPSVSAPKLPDEASERSEPAAGALDFADLDFDFDIPPSRPESAGKSGSAAVPELEPDLVADEALHKPAAKAVDYDLSDINFDLPTSTAADPVDPPLSGIDGVPITAVPESVAADPQEPAGAAASLEFSAEMATKLDLALAYQEIGDREGARELLEEVVGGGNQEQIDRAKTMLQELV